jgi:glycosyltransferase involved in cell wall biosynthesis
MLKNKNIERGNLNLPELSIVLPTYNRIDTLKECIHSVLNQSYQNWELIIVDDSSTTDVEEFIKQKVRNRSRIKYHRNKTRKGLPGSRNVGISISANDLIFFIEDDIILEQNALERLVKSCNMLVSSGEKVGAIAPSRPWIVSENFYPTILNYALRRGNAKLEVPCVRSKFTGIVYSNFVSEFRELQEVPDVHSCSLYPRTVLEEVEGYDEERYKGNFLYEETDLNYRIKKKGYKFYFEPKAILYHKVTIEGGCRVSVLKYGYFFVLNHIKFVTKNFGLKSFYMVPCFLSFITFIATKSLLHRVVLPLKGGKDL